MHRRDSYVDSAIFSQRPQKLHLHNPFAFPYSHTILPYYTDVSYLYITEEQFKNLELFHILALDSYLYYANMMMYLSIATSLNASQFVFDRIPIFLPNLMVFYFIRARYLTKRFVFLSDTHLRYLRSSKSLELAIPTHCTRFYDKTFTIQVVRLWHALPLTIKHAKYLAI